MARLLLDEQLPVRLKHAVTDHYVRAVRDMQWRGLSNGALLARAESEFDVFVTMDTAIRFQQSVAGRSIGVLVIRAFSNSLPELRPHAHRISAAASRVVPGQVLVLDLREPEDSSRAEGADRPP